MIAVVQRVSSASVRAHDIDNYFQSIPNGLLILLGVEQNDSKIGAQWMAKKCANLRIFADSCKKMNESVIDKNGEILAISQFTLAANCRKGNRPSFVNAADPDLAEELYDEFVHLLRQKHGIPTKAGVFQAHMEVNLTNDGPVTIILRYPE